ncbi:MAG: ribose 5-phosphate isomerase B [Spirochaetaceae bacterium]|jgi:ribose 5-phosphate isomerase B|nr:ribose 5-phosphate isomerase B [Spirochaetaceae bacterium]
MIALASDHGGFELKNAIKTLLDELALPYKDFGTDNAAPCDYADYAAPAARTVASGDCDRGLLFCGTGAGMNCAANKVRGIRCVVCSDCFTAEMSRAHNDANMLALGGRVVGVGLARQIVKIWLETPFSGDERHKRRISQIAALEAAPTLRVGLRSLPLNAEP